MADIKSLDKEYVASTYNRFDLHLVKGKGSTVFDDKGKKYIDMGSGIAVTSFGIADKVWQKAVSKQAKTLQHMSNLYFTSPGATLAQMLCEKTGLRKVFFSNSGAEANECAIKVARKYASDKGKQDCFNILTLENSFHGRTLTTLAATGQDHYHELFQPLTPGFVHAKANDIEGVKKCAIDNNVCAIMFEIVQGEGGVLPLEESFVKEIYKFANQNDILIIVDEVQTGNGRCGEMYAYMNFDIKPDIVTTAKGLGGGLPIGCAILGEKVKDTLGYGDHGSTFGGNPVACAGAVSIVERIDDKLLCKVRQKSEYIFSSLKSADGIESVSGMGLMIGIKTKKDARQVVKECMDNGVLCLTAKDKVRLLPALNIPTKDLEKAVQIIKQACKE